MWTLRLGNYSGERSGYIMCFPDKREVKTAVACLIKLVLFFLVRSFIVVWIFLPVCVGFKTHVYCT